MAISVHNARRLTALHHARRDIRAVLERPLHRAIRHRVPLATASRVWELPLECAAAGFKLTLEQDATGWHVELSRRIDADSVLEATGQAKSLLPALIQVVASANAQITHMEEQARGVLADDTAVVTAAA